MDLSADLLLVEDSVKRCCCERNIKWKMKS